MARCSKCGSDQYIKPSVYAKKAKGTRNPYGGLKVPIPGGDERKAGETFGAGTYRMDTQGSIVGKAHTS